MNAALALCIATWFVQASAADAKLIEAAAHEGYVTAINSNDVETLMADLTDDIVYQAPNEPEIIGKAAVRKWVADYFGSVSNQLAKDLDRLHGCRRLGFRTLRIQVQGHRQENWRARYRPR